VKADKLFVLDWENGGIGAVERDRPTIGVKKGQIKKVINIQDKRDLKTLADDFCLLDREDVQDIIETCKSYAEGQRAILRIYMKLYME